MGLSSVPLGDLTPEEPKEMTLDLLKTLDLNDLQNDKSRGQLVIELMFKPFKEDELSRGFEETQTALKAPKGTLAGGGLLVVIVNEAQGLEGKHHNNPYVKLTLRGEKGKTKVW